MRQRAEQISTSTDSSPSPKLHGVALALMRALWLVLVCTLSFSFLSGAPHYIVNASKVCVNSCLFTPAEAQALSRAGISFHAFLWATLIVALMIYVVALSMSLVLFVRRSHEWMGLLIASYLVIYPLNNLLGSTSQSSVPVWYNLGAVLITALGIAPFLVFPSGRFAPSWSWVILVGWLVFWVAFNIFNVNFPLGYLIVYASLVGCQIYRYRRVSTFVERQQTKWILLGFVASLIANQAFWTPFYLPPMTPLASTIYSPVSYLVFEASLLFVPVSFFIAIQRYRLFDIDVIINRALVYLSLTTLLAAIYAGSVVGSQAMVRLITGQDSPVAIVASTLLIAALVQPLRRRVQAEIDRRFYRRKYDATKTMASFSATLRNEVELSALRLHVVSVVQETMQPAYVSLWLGDPSSAAHAGSGASLPSEPGYEGGKS